MKGKVFITGGNGFIGSYIVREFINNNFQVKAFCRTDSKPSFIGSDIIKKTEWVQGDILDLSILDEEMEGCDIVIHSAAKVSFAKEDKKELFKTNIEGTANVVNIALEKNVKKFIHLSSVSTLHREDNNQKISEKNPVEEHLPRTNYGLSKYFGEMEVWRGWGEGLPAIIVNPSTVIGFGDWMKSSCALFRNVYREFPWYSNGINGFVDVRDVAYAVRKLAESDISGERFILSSENWSFKKLFTEIALGFHKKPPGRNATPFLGAIAWRTEKLKSFFSGTKPLLTKETARVAQTISEYDNSKIREFLPGFEFTPLQDAINEACKQYLGNIPKP